MATSADEFDPPSAFLEALCTEVMIPLLDGVGKEVHVPFRAKVSVWVRDQEIPKFLLLPDARESYESDENALVRVRFRRTYRDDRILFSAESQHADVWRKHGFSGVRCHGDIKIRATELTIQLKGKTICYNSGWHGW